VASEFEWAREAAAWLRRELVEPPTVAVVLGSGLGPLAERLDVVGSCPYDAIPHWPPATAIGHAGRLVVGVLGGRRALVLSGRSHLYEGLTAARVAFSIRVLRLLGVTTVVLTNAAGGIAPHLVPGAVMVIDDHINGTGDSPLQGPNDERLGARFPDMSEVYALRLRRLADDAAAERGVPLAHGVYLGVRGPSYETPAEIRAFRTLGADAVGMSTVIEAIAARHVGLDVLGLSCITNLAAGLAAAPITADEVIDSGRQTVPRLQAVLEGVLGRL
jgi:purine-nucleoside phosphorylase